MGLLTDADAEGVDPDRLLEFYRAALRDRWDEQPFMYTPESVAGIVAGMYQPLGPWMTSPGGFRCRKIFCSSTGSPSAQVSSWDISTPPQTGSRSTTRYATMGYLRQSWDGPKPPGARRGSTASLAQICASSR